MGFWKFCEKVSGFVGEELVLTYIRTIRVQWGANRTVGEVADHIRMAAHNDSIQGDEHET